MAAYVATKGHAAGRPRPFNHVSVFQLQRRTQGGGFEGVRTNPPFGSELFFFNMCASNQIN